MSKRKKSYFDNIEQAILNKFCHDIKFIEKVSPHLRPEYFEDIAERRVYELALQYYSDYKKPIGHDTLMVEIDNVEDVSENAFEKIHDLAEQVSEKDHEVDREWLVDKTEEFCKDRSLYNAIMQSVDIVSGDNKDKLSTTAIPKILQDALGVSFDTRVGHDFLDDYLERYEYYHNKEIKIPFDVKRFNQITKGGITPKTLTIFLAGTGVGKSLIKCHLAADWFRMGYNVLYITAEMAEKEIAKRIDQNLLDCTLDELETMPKDRFEKRINRIKSNSPGKLVIKEYPNGKSSTANYTVLLRELETKKNFKPDIIIVDYMNIIASSTVKRSMVADHQYITAIAEELRAFGIENEVAMVTSTQTNRDGIDNIDADLKNTSGSMGGPFTADLFVYATTGDDLRENGQILFKQLKNRYHSLTPEKFVTGIDYERMKIYDLSDEDLKNNYHDDSYGEVSDEDKGKSLFARKKADKKLKV